MGRSRRRQQHQDKPGGRCEETNDCVDPPGLFHAVCRMGECQLGQPGAKCLKNENCAVQAGLLPNCRNGHCQGRCAKTEDCVDPPGFFSPGCIHGECKLGQPGDKCKKTENCAVPTGLDHPVCRKDDYIYYCQSGLDRASCGVNHDCVYGVCNKGFLGLMSGKCKGG